MALPRFKDAPLILILYLLAQLVAVSGFYMPIHSAPPPHQQQPACDPWSRDQHYSSQPPPNICTSPNFDAAVSVSDSQMLLFKGAHMWILDLLNYQVSQPLNNCFLQQCFGGSGKTKAGNSKTKGNFSERAADYGEPQQQHPYYVWNQHEKLRFYRNRICMQGAGKICQFAVDLRPTPTSDVFYRASVAAEPPATAPDAAAAAASSAPFAARNGSRPRPSSEQHHQNQPQQNHGAELCRANMLGSGGDIIEIVLVQRNFYHQREGPQVAQLVGQHFKAFVMYTPSPYDTSLVFFKVELYKLYQEVDRRGGHSNDADDDSQGSEIEEQSLIGEPKHRLIENVNTFAVLPTGELMVFFADHFCLLNYYNLECKLRPINVLLGCGMPHFEYEDTSYSESTTTTTTPTTTTTTITTTPITTTTTTTSTTTTTTPTTITTSLSTTTTTTPTTTTTFTTTSTAKLNSGTKGSKGEEDYDIDFLYRKRDAFKRSPTLDPAELHFGNLSRRLAFLWTGCASLLTIGNRALKSFFVSFAVTHLLAVLLLSLFHRFKRIDFNVLLYIYFFSLGRMMSEM